MTMPRGNEEGVTNRREGREKPGTQTANSRRIRRPGWAYDNGRMSVWRNCDRSKRFLPAN